MKRKWIAIGMILVFVEAAFIPNIPGRIENHVKDVLPKNQGIISNVTMTDWTNDVCALNAYNNKCTVILNSTDIEVDNLDLVQTTYLQQGSLVTLSVQVAGNIENRGHSYYWNTTTNETLDVVEYVFSITTSEQDYMVSYINYTGVLFFNGSHINLTSSDFIVVNNTLSISFALVDPNEIYENLSVIANYLKLNPSKPQKIKFFFDSIPNYWTKVLLFGRYISSPLKGEYMTVIAVNLWMIRIDYHQLLRYKLGDIIRVSTPYKTRIITNHFLFGFFDILQV
jgi:hypothetical protein